jgi:predicted ABC-type ATPase
LRPQYILVAGVNGAGKSTLYRTEPKLFEGTRRLNADEKLQASGGNWRNPADAARAMRDTIKDLRQAIASGESIHQETTLAGSAKSFQNLIDRAHAQGYEVTMLYVSLDSADKAVDRVASRVTKGGHGVDESDIRRRYESSLRNLEELSDSVDSLKIFDNSTAGYETIYERIDNQILVNMSEEYGLNIKSPQQEIDVETQRSLSFLQPMMQKSGMAQTGQSQNEAPRRGPEPPERGIEL